MFFPYRLRSSKPGSFSTKEIAASPHRMPWTHLQEQSHRDDAAAPKCHENKHITSAAPGPGRQPHRAPPSPLGSSPPCSSASSVVKTIAPQRPRKPTEIYTKAR